MYDKMLSVLKCCTDLTKPLLCGTEKVRLEGESERGGV